MKKVLCFFAAITLFSLSGFSQEESDIQEEASVMCFTYEMMDELLRTHPELKENIEQSAATQEAFRKEFAKTYLQKSGDVYTIPVVFHIIHDNGAENISPAQIDNAIEHMNKDFAAENNGVNNVNPAFLDLVSNTGIRFELAKRDPDGNCTNGIVRTRNTATHAGSDNLKLISPIWDRAKYLNIWVCKKIDGGSAGYSRYPSSVNSEYGSAIDGIVVRHDYVGGIGTASSTTVHTLTHEAGHWLDLPHVWGSTNEPGVESNCNTDDGIEDTPNTIGWTACVINGESCGSLDNVENFMEYSYCSKMYTHGQAQRMIAALNSSVASRNELWQESNLIATGVLEDETPCYAEFVSNKNTICVGDKIDFQDFSYNGISQRTWIFESGSPVVSQSATPTVTYNSPGLHNVTLAAGNDSATVSLHKTGFIRVLDTAQIATPFAEGFENISTFEEGQSPVWYTETTKEGINWEITDAAAYSGNKSVRLNGLSASNGESAELLSQTFDMSAFDSTGNATLSFKYAAKKRMGNSNDKLRVYITRNCGDHWTRRKELKGDQLYTVTGTQSTPFVPEGQDEWREITITNIIPAFFTTEFRIKFELVTYNGNVVYIDDINLFNPLAVSVPSAERIKNSVRVYPNPSANEVNIDLEAPEDLSQLDVNMYDISGRLIHAVYSGKPAGLRQSFRIDVSNMPNGLYFIRFNTPHGQFTEKLVVTK